MTSLKMKIILFLLVGAVILTGIYVCKRGHEILSRLERAEENVRALQLARETTEKLLLQQRQMEDSIRSARNESNKRLFVVPALLILTLCGACSKKMPQPVVIAPPLVLLEPCLEPENSYQVLDLIDTGDLNGAKLTYVHYVLDVRDSFEMCNGQLNSIRTYVEEMEEIHAR